ncbi:ComF family protein [Halochromatium salexigens]|uniref:ComF family protein n=1 Tax=Halochromatium salexigens TaxID=49447 RepID=UPI001F5CBA99|nr:ComF family protein [Halochromatium salexigens]
MALLYPPTCVLCGAPGEAGRDLCAGCHADLPFIGAHCARCAQPFPTPAAPTLASARRADPLCGRCQQAPPPFARCTAAFRYEAPLSSLVVDIKFRAKLNLIRLLGALLADALSAERARADWQAPAAIVPVPLHPRRLRTRGYNQALELARVVGRRLAIPVDHRCCRRTRATQAQTELDERLRLTNIRDAFEVMGPVPRHLAILDDVVTTGATVSELAWMLTQAGCERVDVWALARTP